MDYEALIARLRLNAGDKSKSAMQHDCEDAAAAITKLRAERDALVTDLSEVHKELEDMRVELDAARDNCEEWVKKYKSLSSTKWSKSSDANLDNWR